MLSDRKCFDFFCGDKKIFGLAFAQFCPLNRRWHLVPVRRPMELRRFKDILALRSEDGDLLAFHARNLEVAHISEDAWDRMLPTNLLSAVVPEVMDQES